MSSSQKIILPALLIASLAFGPSLYADWSSLHGSNGSAAPARAEAPRPPEKASHPQAAQRAVEPRQSAPVVREQPKAVEPRQMPIVREVQRTIVQVPQENRAPAQQIRTPQSARANEADRRRMDIDQERHQSYASSEYRAGMKFDKLPDGYRRVRFHDHDYFYFDGVYYDNLATGYVVVYPPVGAAIPELPEGAETIVVGDTNYYYADGVFYLWTTNGFATVAAPLGVTVAMLPPGAIVQVINGMVYYQANGTYYQPVFENGVTAYLTVAAP